MLPIAEIHDHGNNYILNVDGGCKWHACHTNTYNGVHPRTVTRVEATGERKPFGEIPIDSYFFLNGNLYQKVTTRTGFTLNFNRAFYIGQNDIVQVATTKVIIDNWNYC